jgi:integrase
MLAADRGGLTPHGLRHTHETLMEELRTPAKLMDERLGHADGSIQARYSHVTATMRAQLLDGLTETWLAALARVGRCRRVRRWLCSIAC